MAIGHADPFSKYLMYINLYLNDCIEQYKIHL